MDYTPIFLINLDRSTDRLERSAMELERLSLDYERISAVDGAELSASEMAKCKAEDFSGYYKKLSPPEIGCYLSHVKCWQIMKDRQLKHVIILEDDFALSPAFKSLCERLGDLPVDWECLKLTEFPEKRNAIASFEFAPWQVIAYDKAPSRTGAYAITLAGAEKMLAHSTKKIARPVDIEFQYAWEHDIKLFGLKPYPVSIVNNSQSTIDVQGSRKKAEKSMTKKIFQKLSFKYKLKKYNQQRLKRLQKR